MKKDAAKIGIQAPGFDIFESDPANRRAPWSLIRAVESHSGLLTVRELAALIRVSECTVYRMAQRKQIPSLMIGGSRFFDPAALGLHFRRKSPESAAATRVMPGAA